MKIKTLENCSLQTIVEAFNEAFQVYFVPVTVDKEGLEQKIEAENIMLRFSVGAFVGDQIVGFILHGLDTIDGEKVVYNAGTGVVPAYRGKGITKQLYRFIRPLLAVEDVKKCRLEVIEGNTPAIHTYKKLGFKKVRELDCFHGTLDIKIPDHLSDIQVQTIDQPNWGLIPSFWNMQPTWQNTIAAMKRSLHHQQFVGLYKGKLLVAYGIVNPKKGRIGQFGVRPAFRGQGLGKLLFSELSQVGKKALTTINIDRQDRETIRFLEAIGFSRYIKGQLEMEWDMVN